MLRVHATAVALVVGAFVDATGAGVVEFTDKNDWIAAVRGFTTIGFTEFPDILAFSAAFSPVSLETAKSSSLCPTSR